tara:strand:+ start:21 stop:620 length:600 start_codon:yes stop_codon:yes gene_type:complete
MTDSGNNPFDKQISNRNYLSPLGFKLVISKIPKVDFLCQSASIPAISMGTAVQPTYLKDIPVPGDKCVYDDLTVRFIIDENMENYLSLNSWIVGLGQPESLVQYEQLEDIGPKQRIRAGTDPRYIEFSDATLQILNSNFQPNINIVFRDIFPISVSTLEFDASQRDYSYFTCEATFKYTLYTISDRNGKRLDNNPDLFR